MRPNYTVSDVDAARHKLLINLLCFRTSSVTLVCIGQQTFHFSISSSLLDSSLSMNKYLTLSFLLVGTCVSSLRAMRAMPNQVCLYQQEDFKGPRRCFKASKTGDLCDGQYGGCHGPWNDKIKSIQFGAGVSHMTLFRHSNFNHQLTVLTRQTKCLDAAFRDFTSFYVAKAAPANKVCLYLQEHFLGKRKCLKVSRKHNLCDAKHGNCGGEWNDKVKSIQFGKRVSDVTLFKHSNYIHTYGKLTQEQPVLAAQYRDFTSLYVAKRFGAKKACVYKQEHFLGKRKCFEIGTTVDLVKQFRHWNTKIRSIQVGQAVGSVDLYADLFTSSECQPLIGTIDQSMDTLPVDLHAISSFVVKA